MARMMLVADDLTGALDAGACLLPADVLVVARHEDVSRVLLDACSGALCVNAATRHLDAAAAAARVAGLVGLAREAGVGRIVKKTDSALRGNVGAELAAAWRASGRDRLHFIPALPEMGRVTRGGVHYIDGVPVEKSAFGMDPFEPVTSSEVVALVGHQAEVPVTVVAEGEPAETCARGIVAYDATSAESVRSRVAELAAAGELGAVAGCAGVTRALASVLGLGGAAPCVPAAEAVEAAFGGNLLVVCGSVNRASREQCACAGASGAPVLRIAGVEKCSGAWLDSAAGRAFVVRASELWRACPLTVVDGSGLEDLSAHVAADADARQVVADHIGALLARICGQGVHGRVLVTGGDVLASFLAAAGVARVRPVGQPRRGIVAFEVGHAAQRFVVLSKSGGFGNRELLVELAGTACGSRVQEGTCCAHA